ncbi:hypothetical protein C6T58_16215 [Burkholderia multivorans]|nr:hypothetical protein C6Q11_06185 [Burkholderia multivorans]PRG80522.1 hypothetical protein C6T58_16215 [Burkholderia multivorans]
MRCASFRSLVATHEICETGGTRLATALPRRSSRPSLHGRCAPSAPALVDADARSRARHRHEQA